MTMTNNNPQAGIAYIASQYKRSTPATYMSSLLKQKPELKKIPGVMTAKNRIVAMKNSLTKDKAPPVIPEIVAQIIDDLKHPCQIVIFQLWVTASRLQDLQQMEYKFYPQIQAVRLRFTVPHKSDRQMTRQVAKWAPCPNIEIARQLWTKQDVGYDKLYRWIRTNSGFSSLSVHSFRDGAIRFLQRLFRPSFIILLTGHTPDCDDPDGTHEYCPPEPEAAQTSMCLRLSSQTLHAINLSHHTTIPRQQTVSLVRRVAFQEHNGALEHTP